MTLRPVSGDIVEMRDGRLVYVTDAASDDLSQYYAVDDQDVRVHFDGPVESIFVGRIVYQPGDKISHADYIEINGRLLTVGGTVVSDMSEIAEIVSIRD